MLVQKAGVCVYGCMCVRWVEGGGLSFTFETFEWRRPCSRKFCVRVCVHGQSSFKTAGDSLTLESRNVSQKLQVKCA